MGLLCNLVFGIFKLFMLLTEGGRLVGLPVKVYFTIFMLLYDLHYRCMLHEKKSSSSSKSNLRNLRIRCKQRKKKCRRRKNLSYWEGILNTKLRSVRRGRKVISMSKYLSTKWDSD
jgi:hypothetical protein